MSLLVRLLGTPHLEWGARHMELPPHKPFFLLVYLACARDWVSRDELLGVFWPDEDEQRARRSLRVLISRAKAPAWVEDFDSEPLRLRWRVASDVRLLREALAKKDWGAVLDLHQRPLLDGFPLGNVPGFEAWCGNEREILLSAWRKATLQRVLELDRDKEHAQAAGLLQQLLERDPLAEDILNRYLEQAYLSGQRDEALKRYQLFLERLKDELDLEPLERTQRLFRVIQQAEPLQGTTAPPAPARNTVP